MVLTKIKEGITAHFVLVDITLALLTLVHNLVCCWLFVCLFVVVWGVWGVFGGGGGGGY